jgi:N-acetylglucosaminyl-diphospho-decaprenol L-rhamnosyltransferase
VKDLSIIYVNWNSLEYLRESLNSVYTNTQQLDYEVIVVDNASANGIGNVLKAQDRQLIVIESPHNLGFAGANNLGYEYASGECLLFLNPDTVVTGLALEIMVEQLRSIPDAGIVGCKLLNTDYSLQTSCIQRFPTIMNQVLDIEWLRARCPHLRIWGIEPLFSKSTHPEEVEVISGACLMIKRQVFETAGHFNREYFMYADDVDLCYKVRSLGLKNYFVGVAAVVHHGGRSSRQRKVNQWAAIMQRKAVMKFCRRTRGSAYAWTYRMTLALTALCRLIILAFAYPMNKLAGDSQTSHSAFEKWTAILRWSIGLDRLTRGLN